MLLQRSRIEAPLGTSVGSSSRPLENDLYKPSRSDELVRSRAAVLSLSSPLSSLFRMKPSTLFAALRHPILYATPHFKDEFARNLFHEHPAFPLASLFPLRRRRHRPRRRSDAERNCGEARREAASPYRD